MPKQKRRTMFHILLVLMGLCLASCAGKKLAVKNADILLEHQITKRLTLYSAQKKQLSKDVASFLNQHKRTANEILPVVDAVDLKKEDALPGQYQRLADFYEQITAELSSMLTKYMSPLDDKQQKDLFETLAQENRELAKRDRKERMKGVYERFEIFFGSITEQQQQHLTNLEDYFEQRNTARLNRRKELHEEFKRIYDRDVSSSTRQELFRQAFDKYQKDALDHKKNLEMIKTLLPTISKNQREHFRERVEDVKEILKYYMEVNY